MMTDIIRLISYTQTADAYGDPVRVETSREIFATPQSIGMKEFYQAAATGLKPELRFVLADYYDYNGEEIVEHEGTRYRVLRTYRTGQELELVVYREVNPG